jgi:UDP-N-acetylglucosamine 2-epimerase (non-hydrolysing)
MACAIVAKKLHIEVAHIESGLRSNDRTMPEEINRLVTDAISDYLLVSEPSGLENLRNEGKPEGCIFFCGNIMIDTLLFQKKKLEPGRSPHAPNSGRFAVTTLHRPSNVDDPLRIRDILEALVEVSRRMPIVFPVHPRTRKQIEHFGLDSIMREGDIRMIEPLSYRDFLRLWKDAEAVFTDSGGIQEETTALGIPCFTIRENTERPITIEQGTNTLVGTSKEKILDSFFELLNSDSKKGRVPELWDGRAAARMVDVLLNLQNRLIPA